MNTSNMKQIFNHYIEKFEMINGAKNTEYYKWQIAKQFRPMMDEALKAPVSEFPDKLKEIKKLTQNLIDSYTQPFQGLVTFAREEPNTVRSMFLNLFSDDGGDLERRSQKLHSFLEKSRSLRGQYAPDSYLYKDDMHSVTGYLFLYDPDHNYIYKATHARKFADCIEFFDEWGSGDVLKLDVYYRMCDMVREQIMADPALLATDESRFHNGWGVDPKTLHADSEKHILVFDLIYCCSTYSLFDGICFNIPSSKERSMIQEKKNQAKQMLAEYDKAKSQLINLEEAKEYLAATLIPGTKVTHRKNGRGTITVFNGNSLEVDFSSGNRVKYLTVPAITEGFITVNEQFANRIKDYKYYIEKESFIRASFSDRESKLASYVDYIE